MLYAADGFAGISTATAATHSFTACDGWKLSALILARGESALLGHRDGSAKRQDSSGSDESMDRHKNLPS
jgi:hypothetical protein